MIRVAVLVVSDKKSTDEESADSNSVDEFINEMLGNIGGRIVYNTVVIEDFRIIQEELFNVTEKGQADLVLTIGGTGFARKNVTPEATMAVIEKETPGIAEYMRVETAKKFPSVVLCRGRAGIRKTSLIINLPDKKEEVIECLKILTRVVPEGVKILKKEHINHKYNELKLWN